VPHYNSSPEYQPGAQAAPKRLWSITGSLLYIGDKIV